MLREIDRRDLTISLRERLGDWFRVVQVKQLTTQHVAKYEKKNALNGLSHYVRITSRPLFYTCTRYFSLCF